MVWDMDSHYGGKGKGVMMGGLTGGHHDLLSLLLLALVVHDLSLAVVDDDQLVLLAGGHLVRDQDQDQEDHGEYQGPEYQGCLHGPHWPDVGLSRYLDLTISSGGEISESEEILFMTPCLHK